MQQVALEALEQAVVGGRVAGALLRVVERVDLPGRLHDFLRPQHRHEVAPRRAPRLQQRVVRCLERLGAFLHALGARAQVAPVLARGRRQVEVQGARAGLGGDHAQHVGRDVERGEREQARRQACGQCVAFAAVRAQVGVDAPRAVRAAGRHPAPERCLRIPGLLATLPCQQPVAPPGLVLLEGAGEFAGQRPGQQRIAIDQVATQLRESGITHLHRIDQQAVQAPAQRVRVELHAIGRDVGVQRAPHELAGRQELEVGRDAVRLRKARLQPAAHRGLRDEDGVGRKQRLARRGRTQRIGQQPRQHLEAVGLVEAEVGVVGGHGCHHGQCAAASSHRVRPVSASPRRGLRGRHGRSHPVRRAAPRRSAHGRSTPPAAPAPRARSRRGLPGPGRGPR